MKQYTEAGKGSPKSTESPKQMMAAQNSNKNTAISSNANAFSTANSKQAMYTGVKPGHQPHLKSLNHS